MSVWYVKGQNQIYIVYVRGRLDQSLTPDLEKNLNELLSAEHNKLGVDLSETNYVNSGGLRTLVSAWRRAKESGGNLVLSGLNTRLQEIFELVGFDKVFQIYPDAKAAERSLLTD
ncbi:MAG: STAS domain-containing protein [Anaerolineales bacterium]|nr:STAS domain-containing protein [Anaerolineales bacterium]